MRHSRRYRKMRGGVAPVNDNSMALGHRASLTQGSGFLAMHKAQHGGAAAFPGSLGVTLPGNMVAAARTGPLDSAIGATRGMQDGGRRRKAHNSMSRKRMSRKRRSMKRSRRHGRKHRGGMARLSANTMLLPPGAERQAALSHEWGLAKDVNAFAPKA
jgi:hypothetical protein